MGKALVAAGIFAALAGASLGYASMVSSGAAMFVLGCVVGAAQGSRQ